MSLPFFYFLLYRISMLFLLAFLLAFLELRWPFVPSLGVAAVCFVLTGAVEYVIFYRTPSVGAALGLSLAEIALVQATALLLSRWHDGRTLFCGFTAAAYVLVGNVTGGLCWVGTRRMLLSIAMALLMHAALLVLLVVLLREPFHRAAESGAGHWGALCVIPVLFYCAIFALCLWPASLQAEPRNALGVLLVLLLMCASYALIIRLTAERRTEDELARSNLFLETYAAGLRRQAEVQAEAERGTAILRHDMRHTARTIEAYLDAGTPGKIRGLLSQMDADLDACRPQHFCENIAVNGILTGSAARAAALGVAFRCHADVPRDLGRTNEYELATVLSNLLENALDAAAALTVYTGGGSENAGADAVQPAGGMPGSGAGESAQPRNGSMGENAQPRGAGSDENENALLRNGNAGENALLTGGAGNSGVLPRGGGAGKNALPRNGSMGENAQPRGAGSGRFVAVAITPVKRQLVCEVTNSCAAQLVLSPETGLPRSAKGAGHGYGLRSVSAFAEKTGALFRVSAANGEFRAQLVCEM